ncbi:hypothetical protein AAVH_40304 [Aphelenchoides avenae]|nr:hypothetical protein AAVH_40304 [Aphelenchus avenae]
MEHTDNAQEHLPSPRLPKQVLCQQFGLPLFVKPVVKSDMSDVDALRRDFALTHIILSVYSRYVDVLIVVHTVLFVTVMCVMKSLNAQSKLSEYGLCLLANNVSVYLFELFMFLGKPTFIPSGIYVPSNGIICMVHPMAGYLTLYAIVFAFFAQMTSMKLSIAFQYGAASSSTAASKLHQKSTAIVKYIFRSTRSFLLSFCTSIALEIGTAWAVLAVTGRPNALEFSSMGDAATVSFLREFR